MFRFIVLSFGFMGWAFYEMSGGSEFDADVMRAARLEAAASKQTPKVDSKPLVIAAAPKVVVDTDPPLETPPFEAEVTRVALNLTTLGDVGNNLDGAVTAAIQTVDAAVPQNVSIITSSADTPAIIPSLINPNDGVATQASLQAGTSADIRTVSGNRVNVRGGPGTDFGIVARLVRGDAVKIIQDDGNGWVQFEALDGLASGWMADFLLTSG